MHRARNLYLLIPLLSLLACDAPTTGPELDSELAATGTADAVLTSGDDLEGPFGPLPVEYPFMPFPDGYRFKNYGGAGDWMLFLETFGNQVNIWSIFDQQYFNNAFIHKFAGGQCYGFSITAGMFHRGVFGPHPSEFQRGAETPFPIPRDTGTTLDEAIERHISKYHYFQYSPEIKEQRIGAFYAADAEPIIAAMEAAQADGWKDSWVLAFRGDRGGHAVNLLNVERTDDGATLTVYDNNFPFREDTNSPVFRKFYFGADEFT